MVQAFDCSHLSPAFSKLAKPAQRALINNEILTVRALSQWTRDDVAKLHGIGPTAFPLLEAALVSEG
jgi:hypothetical protein